MNCVSIYLLSDPRTGEPRYIGKARDPGARLKGHLRECRRRSPLYDWIGKLRGLGLTPDLAILAVCDEADWPHQERRFIAWSRAFGLPMLNLAHGGDEPLCPREVRVSNAMKATATRPKYVMQMIRQMESDVRWARRCRPHLAERWAAGLAAFQAGIDENRRLGMLSDLDRRCALLMAGKRAEALG
jgi:hypothetical protein